MRPLRKNKPFLALAGGVCAIYLSAVVLVYSTQRSMLFFPSHEALASSLSAWKDGERTIGFCHEATKPRTIWLLAHGNAGQAAGRGYVLRCLAPEDSLYVLEYPGYGFREGAPSKKAMDDALLQAYTLLCSRNPGIPIGVIGESIGSGPACMLAQAKPAPVKIILFVPFDTLASVASEKMPFLPVGLMLRDAWDNRAALEHYDGPIDIFGAIDDSVIPFEHAKRLAASLPHSHFKAILGGHNDWRTSPGVMIAR